MNYFFSTIIKGKDFETVVDSVKAELQKEGFGIPTEVDLQEIFKTKINVNFRKYRILGACNPASAHRAILSEKNIGVLLPCSVVVQENENGQIEVAAVDALASMLAVQNNSIQTIASDITIKLKNVIERLA